MAKHAKRLARARKAGFSLVELIIVVAIMVALIAVMAPAYVKYVTRSHDAVVEAAAESVLQFVKAEMADGSLTGEGKMQIKGVEGTVNGKTIKHIEVIWVEPNSFLYTVDGADPEDNGKQKFLDGCGVDNTKTIKSNLEYEITVTDIGITGHPNLQASMDVIDDDNP